MGCQSVYDSMGSRASAWGPWAASEERVAETERGTRAAADEAGDIVEVEDAVPIRGRR